VLKETPRRAGVAAKVADDTEPAVGVIGGQSRDAVWLSPRTTQAEIGVAMEVEGLGRDGRAKRNAELSRSKVS